MNLVKASYLREKDIIIIDVRYNLLDHKEGRSKYDKSHVVGAHFIDLEKDLTSEIKEHGGRHPLKDLDEFKKKVASLGISESSKVVIYDDGTLSSACRLWFMLKLISVDSYIVEGGFESILKEGIELTKDLPNTVDVIYEFKEDKSILVDYNYVVDSFDNKQSILIDSRANERYLGLQEPFDKVAGHIPTAVNYFWKDNFDGLMLKSKEELEDRFNDVKYYDEVIVYCGSGITGAVNLFVLSELGIKAKLYAGSYSDYISYHSKVIVKGDIEKII